MIRRPSVRRPTARRPAAVLAALAVVAILATSCGLSFQSLPKPGGLSGGYTLKAVFANVLNLPVQAQVLIGADQVGQVSSISTKDFKADLTLSIKKSIKIPVGTTAQILFVDPLGDEFIQLTAPSGTPHGPYLHNGDTLGESVTSSAPSIADTLAALGALLNGGGLSQLETIVTNLNQALGGHQQQIRQIINGLAYTVTALNDNKGAVDNALAGLAALSTQLAKGDAAIGTGIDTIGPAVAVLSSENADFSNLLTATNQLATVANSVVNTSSSNIVNTIDQLYAVVNQMVGVESQLGPTLTDLSKFEQETKKIAPGDYLQLSLNGTAIFKNNPYVPLGSSAKTPNAAASTAPTTTTTPNSNQQGVDGLLGAGLP
ncbi:MAG TPA: MCE family protein [Acidimicrobiales bacterium]|jgi:virulence factor Mce-like protein